MEEGNPLEEGDARAVSSQPLAIQQVEGIWVDTCRTPPLRLFFIPKRLSHVVLLFLGTVLGGHDL